MEMTREVTMAVRGITNERRRVLAVKAFQRR